MDTTLVMKVRDRKIKGELKALGRDSEESNLELKKIMDKLIEEEKISLKKEEEEQVLYEKFRKLFASRNELQDNQKGIETEMIGLQHEIRSHEEKIGNFNIQKAQHQAQLESFKFDFKDLETVEILSIHRASKTEDARVSVKNK
jgi:hypothetical protein